MCYKNKQMFFALLDSGVEVSLTDTRGYNSLKEKAKLKKWGAFLQLVKGDSMDVDGCASLKYEICREKQEHEFFVVPDMNRNIILGREWLKHLCVCMYYDLGGTSIGKYYVKMEGDIHISSLARITA